MKQEKPHRPPNRGLQSTDEAATRERMAAEGGKIKYQGLSPANGEASSSAGKEQAAPEKRETD